MPAPGTVLDTGSHRLGGGGGAGSFWVDRSRAIAGAGFLGATGQATGDQRRRERAEQEDSRPAPRQTSDLVERLGRLAPLDP
jgi:hypothetical protein